MVGESGQGRVVFDLPVLLSDEHFLPIDLLRNRPPSRGRILPHPSPRAQNGRAVAAAPPAGSIPVSSEDPGPGDGGKAS